MSPKDKREWDAENTLIFSIKFLPHRKRICSTSWTNMSGVKLEQSIGGRLARERFLNAHYGCTWSLKSKTVITNRRRTHESNHYQRR